MLFEGPQAALYQAGVQFVSKIGDLSATKDASRDVSLLHLPKLGDPEPRSRRVGGQVVRHDLQKAMSAPEWDRL